MRSRARCRDTKNVPWGRGRLRGSTAIRYLRSSTTSAHVGMPPRQQLISCGALKGIVDKNLSRPNVHHPAPCIPDIVTWHPRLPPGPAVGRPRGPQHQHQPLQVGAVHTPRPVLYVPVPWRQRSPRFRQQP